MANIRKGDTVQIIAGKDKGKRGKIVSVLTKKSRVFVEGVNIQKKHLRKSQQNPNGAIVEREGSIHVSNVMKAEKYDKRRVAVATPSQG